MKIIEVIGVENKVSYANVHVLLDNGEEAIVWVGGNVDVYFDATHNKIKAFVKRPKRA